MYELPQTITIGEQQYGIRKGGDYRMVLDCFMALNDVELSSEERLLASLMIFYEDFNNVETVLNISDITPFANEMFKFFNCGENESPGAKVNHKLIDWQKDSNLISSAINKVAGKEIRLEPYVHWWTFMGYYLAIGDSPLSSIVGIRNKIAKGKKLDKNELQFRQNNPQYFSLDTRTVDQQEADILAKELWNSGK